VCIYHERCPVYEIWCEAQADLLKRLASTDFGSLLARQGNGAKPSLAS